MWNYSKDREKEKAFSYAVNNAKDGDIIQLEKDIDVTSDIEIYKKILITSKAEKNGNIKTPLKLGVYKTYVIINGKKYLSITNVGTQPTVNGENEVIETYIDCFFGDLYGENLTVYFVDYIREIKKFNSIDELKNQLHKDKRSLYD